MIQQLGCYQRLAKLAQIQHGHVQNSATEDLLLVLSQRQALLDQIAELEQCISPAKKRWREYLAELSEPGHHSAGSEITTADRQDTLVLQQRKINLGRGINQATAARKFNKTYTAAYVRQSPVFDTQR